MSDDFEMINEALRVAVDDGTVLGVAAMGATSDALAYEGLFGKANAHAGTPMARDTVFWLLSMTKTFTAVACMQLIEQGKLDPEQSAADVLPQLASPRVLDGSARRVLRFFDRPSGRSRCGISSPIPRDTRTPSGARC